MPRFLERAGYYISLPERAFRSLGVGLGGLVYETTQVLLPGWLRGTRIYQILVIGILRISIEFIGGIPGVMPADGMDAGEFTMRKAAGTGIEIAGFLTLGWSPLWLFAVAADLSGGTRVYLQTLVSELQREGLLAEQADITSIKDLLGALERSSDSIAEALDIPPLNVADMRRSWQEMKQHTAELPDASSLNASYATLQNVADREDRSLGDISTLIAAGAIRAGIQLGQMHIFEYYQAALQEINSEGLSAYSIRVIRPYFTAARGHFDPQKKSYTERLLRR